MPSPTPSPLVDRIALVTGGSRGLGAAIVRRLASDGARVGVLDVLPPEDLPPGTWYAEADVTDPAQVNEAVDAFATAAGGLDVVVNNAGVLSGRSSYLDLDREALLRFLTVNVVGCVLVTQAAHPHVVASPHGAVINVASRTFFTAPPGQLGYVASKGAVIGLTRSLARELGEHEVTVNAVMPGQVSTPGTREHSDEATFDATMRRQAIRRRVQPEDLAGLVAFLAGNDARLITGQTIICDGGGHMH